MTTNGENGLKPPSLVCVHGLSASSRWWAGVVGGIGSGQVVLIDVPRSLRPAEVAAWLTGEIEELEPPVHLAGHSLGALVSLRITAVRPDLVRRLILIAPPGIRPRRSPMAYAWPLTRTVLGARPALESGESFLGAILECRARRRREPLKAHAGVVADQDAPQLYPDAGPPVPVDAEAPYVAPLIAYLVGLAHGRSPQTELRLVIATALGDPSSQADATSQPG